MKASGKPKFSAVERLTQQQFFPVRLAHEGYENYRQKLESKKIDYNKFKIERPEGHTHPIQAYHLKHKSGSGKIVLYFHENAGNALKAFYTNWEATRDNGCGLYSVEYDSYSSYFQTPGKAELNDIPIDDLFNTAEKALKYLIEVQGYKKSDIILAGISIGCSPALYLASKHEDFGGLVLFAPFQNGLEVSQSKIGVRKESFVGKFCGKVVEKLLPNFDNFFPNDTMIRSVSCPISIIGNSEDNVATPDQIYSLCRNIQNQQDAKSKFPMFFSGGHLHQEKQGDFLRRGIERITDIQQKLKPKTDIEPAEVQDEGAKQQLLNNNNHTEQVLLKRSKSQEKILVI